MKTTRPKLAALASCLAALVAFMTTPTVSAHCDGLDGPVVSAARRALDENNANLALVWVQKEDETEIKRIFAKTLIVRKLSPEARELADLYFFETLVRLHRAGEGEPYTGLKPAGRDLGPAIPAGDKALATGDLEPVARLLSKEVEHSLHQQFGAASAKKKFPPNDLAAGRAYVKAYVSYIHFVDGVYRAASAKSVGHAGERTDSHEHR